MNFPATDYEMIELPIFSPQGKASTPNLYRIPDHIVRRLVRARIKSELPKGSGLVPQKLASGNFGWLWWGLRDDYGRMLARKERDPMK